MPERAHDDARGEAQPAADEGVPRARVRRGHLRARVPARRARGEARPRPARAAAPQLRRARTPTTAATYSGKDLGECYRRAEPHWERRHEVRARSTATVKRGVGMASQIWFGGGGPPSYAWVRVGADARGGRDHGDAGHRHRDEDGARADRGRGARPPARARVGRRSATPRAGRTRCSRPARRRRRRWARRRAPRPPTRRRSSSTSRRSGTARRRVDAVERGELVLAGGSRRPLEELLGVLGDGQLVGTGARGPNPAGMPVRRSASTSPRSRSTSRPARSRSSGSRRSTTSAA